MSQNKCKSIPYSLDFTSGSLATLEAPSSLKGIRSFVKWIFFKPYSVFSYINRNRVSGEEVPPRREPSFLGAPVFRGAYEK